MASGPVFDWDRANIEHISCHRVRPDEVEQVFANESAELAYENFDGEPRWTVVGHTDALRVLLVVWTSRGGRTAYHRSPSKQERAGELFQTERVQGIMKRTVPKFQTEDEEARWWDEHLDELEQEILQTMNGGSAQILTHEAPNGANAIEATWPTSYPAT